MKYFKKGIKKTIIINVFVTSSFLFWVSFKVRHVYIELHQKKIGLLSGLKLFWHKAFKSSDRFCTYEAIYMLPSTINLNTVIEYVLGKQWHMRPPELGHGFQGASVSWLHFTRV